MKFISVVAVVVMSFAAYAGSEAETSPVFEVLMQWQLENQQAADGMVENVALRPKKRKCARYYSVLDNYRRPHLDGGWGAKPDPFCEGL